MVNYGGHALTLLKSLILVQDQCELQFKSKSSFFRNTFISKNWVKKIQTVQIYILGQSGLCFLINQFEFHKFKLCIPDQILFPYIINSAKYLLLQALSLKKMSADKEENVYRYS